MAAVNVTNIRVLNNPCPLNAPFLFEIHFEAQQALKHDVEWRVVYVGSGEHHTSSSISLKERSHATSSSSSSSSSSADDTCMHADGERQPPPPAAAGVTNGYSSNGGRKQTAHRGADFVLDSVLLGPIERGALAFEFAVNAPDFTQMDPGSVEGMQAVLVCGLYKGKEFVRIGYYLNNAYSDCALRENPPETPIYDRLVRCVVDAPRVTRFQIEWDEEEEKEEEEQQQQQQEAEEEGKASEGQTDEGLPKEQSQKGEDTKIKAEGENKQKTPQLFAAAAAAELEEAGASFEMDIDVN
ncbi:hypothetical protein Efla_002630 [Eimeria flavescens]